MSRVEIRHCTAGVLRGESRVEARMPCTWAGKRRHLRKTGGWETQARDLARHFELQYCLYASTS